jgi:hypothetical protein
MKNSEKLEVALNTINQAFVYQPDPKIYGIPIDTWRIISKDWKGDCEDYSLTVIWLYSDRNIFKFIWNILSIRFLIYFVSLSNGEKHVVTRFESKYFDNIQQKLVTKEELEKQGYRFIFPMISPIVFGKLFVSYVLLWWIRK